MVVDFHTHIFPDKLAKRALSSLLSSCNALYQPVHDGTAAGLIQNMDAWGIDLGVVLPVITKPAQLEATNLWAKSLCSKRIVCFGGVHPHTSDYKKDIDFVVGLGLKGVKLHAEYQDFVIDDAYMLKFYDYAFSKGLIIVQHAGFDPAYPPPFKSSPKRFANIAKMMQGGVMVAAHLGGHAQWDEVEEHLCGTNIYLDTSMGFEYFDNKQFLRIVQKHGAQKILFGSDAPWSNAQTELAHLNALPLTAQEKDLIKGGNAARLLGNAARQ